MGAAWSSCTGYDGRWGQVTVQTTSREVLGVATMVFYTHIQAIESGSSLGSSDNRALG